MSITYSIGGHYTEVYCSGRLRRVLTVLWEQLEGPRPLVPDAFINNGCTLSPDTLLGREVWPACVLHDYQATAEGAAAEGISIDRAAADAAFRRNITFLLKAQGVFTLVASAVAWAYWRGVRRGGRRFYSGSGDPS